MTAGAAMYLPVRSAASPCRPPLSSPLPSARSEDLSAPEPTAAPASRKPDSSPPTLASIPRPVCETTVCATTASAPTAPLATVSTPTVPTVGALLMTSFPNGNVAFAAAERPVFPRPVTVLPRPCTTVLAPGRVGRLIPMLFPPKTSPCRPPGSLPLTGSLPT